MPFPTTLWEDKESLNFAHQFIYTFTAFVSEILLVLRQSFVRFRPHLPMYKYHVLSMEYFVDITWFIPKKKRIFHFYGHVHTFDCCRLDTTRTALIAAERSYTRWKHHDTLLKLKSLNELIPLP